MQKLIDKVKKVSKLTKLTIVLLILLPSIWWFFGPGYFMMHDDLQVMRVYEMFRCYLDGQIPCRWSPDMTYGYGQAMFNFYSAFPYYLGLIYKLIFSATFIGSAKFLFATSLIMAGTGMYFLAREFWGFLGGVVSAVLYTYAPYHAVDVYVRGALAESFGLAIIPYVWLFIYKTVKEDKRKNILLLSASLSILFSTHNISMLIFAPFTVVWIFYWLYVTGNWKKLIDLFAGGILGIGLAAYFIIPAIFEQRIIQTEYLISDYSNYTGHFINLNQLFISRFWGDGGSIFGTNDGMSFAVGWPHWWLIIVLLPLSVWWIIRKKKAVYGVLIAGLIAMFFTAAFLTHQRSIFIWQNIPLISFVQFPWRFVGPAIFLLSLAGGAIASVNIFMRLGLSLIAIVLTFYYNISYFTPVHYSRQVIDSEKLSGVAFELQQKGGAADYIPKGVEVIPQATAFSEPKFRSGEGEVKNYVTKTNGFEFYADLKSDSEFVLPIIYFPEWIYKVDGVSHKVETQGAHNIIMITVPEGKHQVIGEFKNTPVRSFANALSVFSTVIFVLLVYKFKKPPSLLRKT